MKAAYESLKKQADEQSRLGSFIDIQALDCAFESILTIKSASLHLEKFIIQIKTLLSLNEGYYLLYDTHLKDENDVPIFDLPFYARAEGIKFIQFLLGLYEDKSTHFSEESASALHQWFLKELQVVYSFKYYDPQDNFSGYLFETFLESLNQLYQKDFPLLYAQNKCLFEQNSPQGPSSFQWREPSDLPAHFQRLTKNLEKLEIECSNQVIDEAFQTSQKAESPESGKGNEPRCIFYEKKLKRTHFFGHSEATQAARASTPLKLRENAAVEDRTILRSFN